MYPFVDLDLSRRLERAEAHANRRFVEARGRLFPERGAGWMAVGGTYAMFDGVGSPLTQTFGLGLFDPPLDAHLEALEVFFAERDAEVFHEVSPLADLGTLSALNARGYRPCECTSVMFRPTADTLHQPPPSPSPWPSHSTARVHVRLLEQGVDESWGLTSARGWSEAPELALFLSEMGQVSAEAEDACRFLGQIDDLPVATGLLSMHGGVALLAGASTVPGGRRQGAQLALLESRLRYAAEQGCDLAMMCALPGSASQRNAERHGFRIAYTRIKWRRWSTGTPLC